MEGGCSNVDGGIGDGGKVSDGGDDGVNGDADDGVNDGDDDRVDGGGDDGVELLLLSLCLLQCTLLQ